MTTDRRFRTDGRKARVVHVPLTDAEHERLRDMAYTKRETIGDLASSALRAAYPLTPKGKR